MRLDGENSLNTEKKFLLDYNILTKSAQIIKEQLVEAAPSTRDGVLLEAHGFP